MSKLFFKFLLAVAILPSFASALECYKNTGHQGVKQICFLENAEGKTKGFLLFNANGTKSYLKVYRQTFDAWGAQEYGRREWNYFVRSADSNLEVLDTASSKIQVVQSWEYSMGGSYLTGSTPGGRELFATIESGDGSEE